MKETLRQKLAAQWMLQSVEERLEQLLTEKASLERTVAELAQQALLPHPHTHLQTPLPPPRSGTMPDEATSDSAKIISPESAPSGMLAFKTATKVIRVTTEDILYAEADGKCSTLWLRTEEKPQMVFHLLAEIEERLQHDKCFVRCSRFHLVNLTYCKGWRHNLKKAVAFLSISEKEGKEQEITVTSTFKAAFLRYWEDYIRANGEK